MKRIKDITIGFILGIVVLGSLSVYAVEAVIESKEVSYDNKESHGRSEDVQGSIDELYERSGIMKSKWVDPILNGADPVFDSSNKMIPVEINRDGTVKYANLYTKWYEYEEKRWANAVILVDSEKGKYKTGDKIPESAIESYFVWIPRYKYKIWDLGNYTTYQSLTSLKDTANDAEGESPTTLRRITGNARVVDIIFETQSTPASTTQTLNSYYTHPAFTLGNTELNGIWVGKFETGYNQMESTDVPININGWTTTKSEVNEIKSNNIIVKPNVYSWRNQTVGKMFKTALNYESTLGSHMIKNTEWGAVAYLSHSIYGIGREVNINNNSEYKTGYSAAANTDQSSCRGIYGTEKDVTQPWNTSTGYLASTTGNITGIYDMIGGTHEYVAAYMENYGVISYTQVHSDLTNDDLKNYTKFFDKYSTSSTVTSYDKRILGDATGEMGPFYQYYDKDKNLRNHNAWYADTAFFIDPTYPWFDRGGDYSNGVLAGQFTFARGTGGAGSTFGSRIALAF